MSFKLPAQATKAGVPGTTDDASKGYVIGSAIVDTSVTPRRVYICTDATTGAATWVDAGGVTVHADLTGKDWGSAGHSSLTNSVACFDSATGAAQTVQATEEGSVLALIGGVLAFTTMAAAVAVIATSSKTIEVLYNVTTTDVVESAAIGPGSFV